MAHWTHRNQCWGRGRIRGPSSLAGRRFEGRPNRLYRGLGGLRFVARLRRFLTALVLAAGTFALLFAGTGAAEASDGPGALDGRFAVAASRPGDKAVYALDLVVQFDGEMLEEYAEDIPGFGTGEAIVLDAGARWELTRLADRLLPDGTGLVPVSSFASSWGTEKVDWFDGDEFEDFEDADDYGYDGGDYGDYGSYGMGAAYAGQIKGEPWHVVHVGADHQAVAVTKVATEAGLPGQLLATDLGADVGTSLLTTFGPASAPCGFHSDLQDAAQPLAQPIHVDGACPPPGGTFGLAPDPLSSDLFLAAGHDLVEGREAIVYALQSDPEAMKLWFTADTPYPVRMLLPLMDVGDEDASVKMHLMYEMTEFTPGSLAPLSGDPPLALAPRLPTGPDAAGVDHPFPLVDALAAAQADAQDPGTRDFLAAHPDAVLDEARFVHVEDDGAQERWAFTLVGGSEALHVTATKGAPMEPPAAVPGPVPVGLPKGLPIDDGVVVHSAKTSSAGRASATQMPAALPSVAGLLDAWQRDGGAGGVPSWAFRLAPDGAWVAAGHAEATVTRGTTGEPTADLVYSFMGVGPDGRFRFVEESPARYDVPGERDPESMGRGYDAEDDDSYSDPRGIALASVGFWEFPQAKTTATVSAAATLIGLLAYLLLPAKFGLGLFSRIGDGQVLEHPLRAQIAALVEAEPGIHFQEIVRRLDAGRGTTEHHLRKLLSASVVTAQVSQGFTCYFPKGKVDRHLMAAAPVLKSDGARQVLQCIQEQPGRAALDVAGVTGLTPSTVNYHLKRLMASGLVSHERRGRFLLLTPTPLGTQALGAWGRT